MSAPVMSRADHWQRWLYAVGPGPRTVRGVAWRLSLLWPPLIALRVWLPAALTFAVCALARAANWEGYQAWAGFAAYSMLPVLPVVYTQIFEMQGATFSMTSGRALAVLPVPGTRLRDAAWLVDVLLPVLRNYIPSILVLAVLPLPFWFKHWYAAALFLALTVLGGLRATGQLGQIRAKLSAEDGLAALKRTIDSALMLGAFLSMLAMMLRGKEASTSYGAAIVCAATVLWSYLRTPLLGSGRDSSGTVAKAQAKRRFSSAYPEMFRIFIPALMAPPILMAAMYAVALFMGRGMPNQFPMMTLFGCIGLGANLAMRVRPTRVLPLTTRQLTQVVLLYGASAAISVALLVLGISTAEQPTPLALLLASAAGLWMTALVVASMWMVVFQAAFMLVMMALIFTGVFMGILGVGNVGITTGAVIGNVSGAFFLALALTTVHRDFLWHPKVYRPVFQHQQQMQVGYTTDWGETLALLIYGAICVGATILGGVALVSG